MPTMTENDDTLTAFRRVLLEGVSREQREYGATFEVRATKVGDTTVPAGWVVNGYASVFDHPYEIWGGPENGGWNETMRRGAFTKTLSENPDVMFLINHEGMPLARTRSGTLKLETDISGLRSIADLDGRSQRAAELAIAMERKDMNEMSFAFRVMRDMWLTKDGEEVPWWDLSAVDRHILEVSMHKGDTSVVNFGANDATDSAITARSVGMKFRELRAMAGALSTADRTELGQMLKRDVMIVVSESSTDTAACPTCTESVAASSKFCNHCGASMTTLAAPAQLDYTAAMRLAGLA